MTHDWCINGRNEEYQNSESFDSVSRRLLNSTASQTSVEDTFYKHTANLLNDSKYH